MWINKFFFEVFLDYTCTMFVWGLYCFDFPLSVYLVILLKYQTMLIDMFYQLMPFHKQHSIIPLFRYVKIIIVKDVLLRVEYIRSYSNLLRYHPQREYEKCFGWFGPITCIVLFKCLIHFFSFFSFFFFNLFTSIKYDKDDLVKLSNNLRTLCWVIPGSSKNLFFFSLRSLKLTDVRCFNFLFSKLVAYYINFFLQKKIDIWVAFLLLTKMYKLLMRVLSVLHWLIAWVFPD